MIRTSAFVSLLLATAASAAPTINPPQNSKPQQLPIVDTIPAPQDVPYPGTLTLDVDASDTSQGIFRVNADAYRSIMPDRWCCSIRSGCLATIRSSGDSWTSSPGWSIEARMASRIRLGARSGRRIRLSHRRAGRRKEGGPQRIQFVSATDPGIKGRIVMTPDHHQPAMDLAQHVSGRVISRATSRSTATVHYPAGFSAASGLPSKGQRADLHL